MKAGGQGSRYSILLNRIFGLREDYVPVDVAPETLPIFDIGSSRFEMLAPRGDFPFVISLNQAAVVGEFSFVGLANPANSGRFIVVETVQNELATQSFNRSLRRLSVVVPTANLTIQDGRRPQAYCLSGFVGSEAAVPQTDARLTLLQGVDRQCFAALPPGTDFRLETIAVNVAVPIIYITGYVRECRPDEMSL